MARSRTRERQLKKLAARRDADRRRQRRTRIIAGTVAGFVVLGGVGAGVLAVINRKEKPVANANKNQAVGGVACGAEKPAAADLPKPSFDEPPKMQIDDSKDYSAEFRTSCGTFVLDLFEDKAPKTVNNFVFLARQGFYDGQVFHRVIPGFMNQGGDPQGTGTGGPGYQFEDEFGKGLDFSKPGILAMANSGPDTNGSQFFITTGTADHLTGVHSIFGTVAEGMDVVEKINKLPTDPNDRPTEAVYMEAVVINEA